MDDLRDVLLGQPHPGGAPYLELTLERVYPELSEGQSPLTKANLAIHAGAPLPPQPWSATDTAVFTRVQYYLTTFPIEEWRRRVGRQSPPSDISLLSAGEVYTATGHDIRRHPWMLLGACAPDARTVVTACLAPHFPPPLAPTNRPSAPSTCSGDASTPPHPLSSRGPSGTRSLHASIDFDPPSPRQILSRSPGRDPATANPDMLEQMTELRTRLEVAEARARHFEVGLARIALALETERARARRGKRRRTDVAEAEWEEHPAKRRPSTSCRTSEAPSEASPGRSPVPRAEAVARALDFLVNRVDEPPINSADAWAGMAGIAQLYGRNALPQLRPSLHK